MYKASTRNYPNQLWSVMHRSLGIRSPQSHFHKLQLTSFGKSQYLQTLIPQFPHVVVNINPKNNITLETLSNNKDYLNPIMQNSIL
jgi:hypothetical protein